MAKEKMRIHIMVNAFWQMSGGDKRIIEMLRRWVQLDNEEFEYYIYAPQKFIDILQKEKIENIVYRCTQKEENANIIVSYIMRTYSAIRLLPKELKGDIFYSTSDYFPDVFPAIYGKKRGYAVKWISMIHHIIEDYRTRQGNQLKNLLSSKMQKNSFKRMRKKADCILVVSPLVQKYLINHKFDEGKIKLVDNGVDVAFIDKANEKCPTSYDAIMLARLVPSKGIFDLPEIWKKVCEKKPEARLGLIGNASEEIKSKFIAETQKTGVEDKIDLLGYMSSEEAYSYLKNAKIFVFTSREEGWGISLAEAMCCDIPVVAFELPVYKYIFKDNILYVEDRNKEKMADRIVYLLDNPLEAKEIAKRGSKFVRGNYDWNVVAQKELDIIKKTYPKK